MPTLADLIRIVSQATERRRHYAAWLVAQHARIHLGGLGPNAARAAPGKCGSRAATA